jgi:hypothetical protein
MKKIKIGNTGTINKIVNIQSDEERINKILRQNHKARLRAAKNRKKRKSKK